MNIGVLGTGMVGRAHAGEMAVAYFQVHFPRSFWPVLNGGEPAALYCFLWLYFRLAGSGPWSLDVILKRKVRSKATASSSGTRVGTS